MALVLNVRRSNIRSSAAPIKSVSLVVGVLAAAACASSSSSTATQAGSPSPMSMSTTAPSPDPRVGLKAGWFDAGTAAWNLALISNTPPSSAFINKSTPGDRSLVNSDLAFTGHYAIQGNYSGYQVWDISNPS